MPHLGEKLIETLAARARNIARANYDHGHQNLGTWEDAVAMHLAISQAISELYTVDRGPSSDG